MPHLAFALLSVLAHVAGAEEAKLYELMKTEYTDESCEAAGWGPFPNATSTSLTAEAFARSTSAARRPRTTTYTSPSIKRTSTSTKRTTARGYKS